ncbi:MAG: RadC family protein [Endomicrobiales bacterium]
MTGTPRPHYLYHRKRLKTKYLSGGIAGWQDYEVLEYALTFALSQKDTKPLAKELLARFKGLSGVLDAPVKELTAVKGIGPHTALLLKLLRDAAEFYLRSEVRGKDLVSSPGAAARYLQALLRGTPDERFCALFLDTANRLLAVENLQTGTVNRSAVYPRKVAERALHHHAAGVIIAHNHPAGTLCPSEDDLKATRAVKSALEAVETSLLDHLLVAGDAYFSWKEHALL